MPFFISKLYSTKSQGYTQFVCPPVGCIILLILVYYMPENVGDINLYIHRSIRFLRSGYGQPVLALSGCDVSAVNLEYRLLAFIALNDGQ